MGKYVAEAEKPKKKRKKGQSGKAQRKGDKQEHASKQKKEEKATGNDSLNKKQNKVTKIFFFFSNLTGTTMYQTCSNGISISMVIFFCFRIFTRLCKVR